MTDTRRTRDGGLDIAFQRRGGAWWCGLTLGGRLFDLEGPATDVEAVLALDVWVTHLTSPDVFSATMPWRATGPATWDAGVIPIARGFGDLVVALAGDWPRIDARGGRAEIELTPLARQFIHAWWTAQA